MVNKPKFLKNLLTTVSAAAVAMGAANAYGAAVISNNAAPAVFSTGVNFLAAGVAPAAPVAAATNVYFGVAQNMNLDTAAAYGTLNVFGWDGKTVHVTAASSFSSIINDYATAALLTEAAIAFNLPAPAPAGALPAGVTANATVNFSIDAAVIHTFNQIAALGNITFTNAAATATFSGQNTTINGTIDGNAGGNQGNVVVNQTGIIFANTIGAANAINTFTVNNAMSATLNKNVTTNGDITISGTLNTAASALINSAAGNIVIGDGATLTTGGTGAGFSATNGNFKIGNGSTVTTGAGDQIVTNAGNVTIGDGSKVTIGAGGLFGTAAGSFTIGKGSTVTTGAGASIGTLAGGSFIIGDGSTVTTGGTGGNVHAGAGNITIGNGSTLTVGAGDNITANAGAGDITATTAGKGTLTFLGNSKVTSTIGNANGAALAAVNIGAGTVELLVGNVLNAPVNFTAASGVLKLSAANTTVTGGIPVTTSGQGTIQINANGISFIGGNVGTTGNSLGAIAFVHNNAAAPGDAIGFKNNALEIHVKQVSTLNANQGLVGFQGDKILIDGNFGQAALPINHLALISNFANNAATTATLAPNSIIYGAFDLSSAAYDNILILQDNTAINGRVFAGHDANGTLQIAGNTTIGRLTALTAADVALLGVGAAPNRINKLLFTTAGKKLTVQSGGKIDVTAPIEFQADATLSYANVDGLVIDQSIKITTPVVDGVGTILANRSQGTIDLAQVGDTAVPNSSLKLLQATGGATNINLAASTSILKIDVGTQQDTVLTLKTAGDYMIGNFNHGVGQSSLQIGLTGGGVTNVTLKKGSFANDDQLKAISLTNNNAVTFEDGVNLSAANGFANDGISGNGSLIFLGKSNIEAVVGTALSKFNAITLNANSAVNFFNDVHAGAVAIGTGGNATFIGALDVTSVNSDATNNGTLTLQNTAPLTVSIPIGNTNALTNVILGGSKDTTFSNATFKTTNLTFGTSSINATFSKLGANAFQTVNIATSATPANNVQQNIILPTAVGGVAQNFTAAVGSSDKPLGNFVLTGDDTITVNTKFYASITTQTNDQGTVIFTNPNSFVINLGDSTHELKIVDFNQSTTVQGNVFAKNIAVAGNKIVNFEGNVNSSAGMQLHAASTAAFADGATLASLITGQLAGKGAVTFAGNINVNQAIGATSSVASVNFNGAAGSAANLAANITANNIAFGNVTAVASKNVTLTGATQVSSVSLGTNQLTFAGGASALSGASVVNVTLAADGSSMGQVIVSGGAGASLNLDGAVSLTIVINDAAPLSIEEAPLQLFVVAKNDAATLTPISAAKVTITQPTNNRFANWSYAGGALTRTNNAATVLPALMKSSGYANLAADAANLGNTNNTGDAAAVQADFAKMDDATLVNAVSRLVQPIATTSSVATGMSAGNKQIISNRLSPLVNMGAGLQTSDLGSSGVAAGDDEAKHGAWVSPFFNQATQGKKKDTPGYKANSFGAMIGVDTMANADMTIGVAVTYLKTDVKHKNFKSGDKTKLDTYMFNIYGVQQLTDNWFMQAIASFSSSKVKNTEMRVTAAAKQTAKGTFDTTTYGGEVLFGYNYRLAETTVTPLFGLNFTRVNDGGYRETGTTNQNLTITKKAVNNCEAIVGLRSQIFTSNMNGLELTPEVHGYVRHNVVGKNPTVTAKLDGMAAPITPKKVKMIKTIYNIGFGLNTKSGMFDYGIGYDLNVADKYLSNQGTLKVRVNF